MRRFTNLGSVLKKKVRIYAWLLLGFIPMRIYGATECYAGPDSTMMTLLSFIADVLMVTSLWIVIWRWEAIEQRKIARRARILLLGISFAVGFVVFGTFFEWCVGRGHEMYLPIILSSAPLSVLPVFQRLGLASAPVLGPVLPTLKTLTMLAMQFGTPVLWGTRAVLVASPRSRRRRRQFLGTILSHYLVGVVAIVLMTAEDWKCLRDIWHAAPEALAGWALVYIAAHILLWGFFLRNRTEKDPIAGATIPVVFAHSGLELNRESPEVLSELCDSRRS
jgi:hypothetical protein